MGCLEDGFPWWIRFQLVNNSHGDGWLLSCKDRVVGNTRVPNGPIKRLMNGAY